MSASIQKSSGSINQQAMSFEQVREIVIHELRAESLTKGEQDKLMQMVGEALMERATLALMKSAPPELLIEFSDEEKDPRNSTDAAFFMQKISEAIPNAQTIVVTAIKEGLQDYQKYLDSETNKR